MLRNMVKWASDIIDSDERKIMPVLSFPGVKLIGKSVKEMVSDGEMQYLCINAITQKYESIAALTLMDLSVEAEAFGSPVSFSEDEVPTVRGRIIATEEDAAALRVPEPGAGRTGEYLKAARLASENIKDRPVFGGIIGPFSLSGRLMDMTEIMIQALIEPDFVHSVLEKATLHQIAYAKAYKEAGVNGIIIAEPAAGLLPPGMCDEFSSVYVKRIVEAVQDENFIVILHNCGNTVPLVESMISTGAAGLHFGNAVDMADILPQISRNILVFGNVDPARTLRNGTAAEIIAVTKEVLEKGGTYDNFVLSSGCDIPPLTSFENLDAFFGTLKEYNAGNEIWPSVRKNYAEHNAAAS